MFKLTTSNPCNIQGTIRVVDGINRLGPLTDADGNNWHIWGYGKDDNGWFCWATDNIHPWYTDTSNTSYGFIEQRWLPYRVEIVTNE